MTPDNGAAGRARQMNRGDTGLPAEAIDAAQRGKLVEAIKLTREHTGLGLKEAKDAVEAYLDKAGKTHPRQGDQVEIPLQAILALRKGVLIEAVRHTREATGLGLKDSKAAVERYLDQNPATKAQFKTAAAAEFRRIAGNALLLLAFSFLLALAYLYLAGGPG